MTATQIFQLCVKRRLTIKDIEDFESAVRREQIEKDAMIAEAYRSNSSSAVNPFLDAVTSRISEKIRAQLKEMK